MTLRTSAIAAWMRGRGWVRLPAAARSELSPWLDVHPIRAGLVRLASDPWEGLPPEMRQTAARAGAEIIRAWREDRQPDPSVMAGDMGAVLRLEVA